MSLISLRRSNTTNSISKYNPINIDEVPTSYSAVASGIGILSKSVFRKRQAKHSNIAATTSHFPTMPNGTSCQICQLMYAALAETPTKSSPIIHVKFIRTIFCSFVFYLFFQRYIFLLLYQTKHKCCWFLASEYTFKQAKTRFCKCPYTISFYIGNAHKHLFISILWFI